RIACREMVSRNLLALAEGAAFTVCWNLAPEVPDYRDPLNLMGFVSAKLNLMDFVHGDITRREPSGEAFARLSELLSGANAVRRLDSEPGLVVIEIEKDTGSTLAFLLEGDPLVEDEPPRLVEWEWV